MIVSITAELISAVTGVPSRDFQHLRALDLHLKDLDLSHQQEDEEGSASPSQATPKIRKIESLHLVANLRQLNLGYNAITRIEGLSALSQLVELNLAENAIRKIENLDGLKSLERLNLSGNQIERIPEMMKSLHRLTHFRIARNQLTHIGDLTHLASLDKLTNLRIDDNPISELEHIMVYTVFHIPSLIYLDGVEISDKLRDQGRKKYAGDQLSSLKSKLNAEQHRLQRLRRELQSGPEAHFVMQAGHQSLTLSRPQQVQLDDANRILAMKLDEVKRVESEIHRLTEVLQRMNSSSTGSPSHIRSNEVAYSSPEADEYESESFEASRSFVNPNKATPFASSSTAAFNANKSTSSTVDQSKLASSTTDKMFRSPLPAADNIAGKKLVDLNDKVEKLAAKVLTSEKEKQVLKTQLDQQKSSSETVQRLRNELEECEMQLEQALHAAKQSNDEANDLQKDNDRLQASLQENRQQLQSKQREVDVLQSELISMRQESNELRRLVRENKQVGDVLRKSSTQNISSYSLMDEMRTQDLRIQAMNQKLSMDEMQSLNERLSRELESYILQTNTLNTTLLRCREENDHLKGRLQVVEQGHHERESHVIMLESEQRRLQQSNDELRHQQASMLKEKENLLMKMSVLETDLQSLLYAKRKTPQKSNTPARQYTLNVPPQQEHHQDSNGVRNNNYFEQASMDSDYEGLDFPSTATAAARIHQHQQQRRNGGASTTSTTAQLAPTTKFAISALERSAAEIIAHLILEEMQQSKTMSMGTSMKEACVRAALRLVHTSSIVSNDLLMEAAMDDEGGMAEEKSNLRTPTRGGGGVLHKKQKSLQVPMTPFHALGDRAVLSKLVADTHAGLVAIEDSNLLKEEMRQLQVRSIIV